MIAHEAVTAIDEGLSDGAFGSLCMDDEGMEPQRTVLIENGVLKRFLSDRAGELRTGHARTGSGRRQGHSFAAASRMRNTFIAAGPHSPDELIASVDQGLYCKSMGGGSVGPTGQFNFAPLNLTSLFQAVRELGARLGVEDRASALCLLLEARIDSVRQRTATGLGTARSMAVCNVVGGAAEAPSSA